jgi:hypothetical protein
MLYRLTPICLIFDKKHRISHGVTAHQRRLFEPSHAAASFRPNPLPAGLSTIKTAS